MTLFSRSFSPGRLATVVLLSLGAIVSRLVAADKPAEPVIELPKFVVTDSRELPSPESWRYAQIPGIEVLSNASDKAAERLIRDFERFRVALSVAWPMPNRNPVPISLILCGKGGKFDAFAPVGKDAAESTRASLFLRNREQTAIIIDLQSTVLDVLSLETDDPAAGTDSTQISVDHNKQLYREYVRYLLSPGDQRLPTWLTEGMAQIVMAMKFDRKQIIFGQIEDPNLVSARAAAVAQTNAENNANDSESEPLAGAPMEDRDFNAALSHKGLVPLEKFFAVTDDSPEATNPLGNNRWAKQAYAFVHLCLYGQKGKYQKAFAAFVARAGRGPVTEEVFKECFKMSYSQMLLELRGYIEFTVYQRQEFHAKGAGMPEPPPFEFRDATPAEIGRIKGEALALGGHQDRAHTEFIAPYIRGETDARLLAALGLNEHAVGQDDRARKLLEAAVSAKVVRPRAYLELARLYSAEALAKPSAPEGAFTPAQVSAVLAPLLVAREQPAATVEIYELIAETWGRSAVKPKRDDLTVLFDGVRLFPSRLRLVYLTAALCVEAGQNDAAASMVEFGEKIAPDAKSRAPFSQLRAALPAAAFATPVPSPAR